MPEQEKAYQEWVRQTYAPDAADAILSGEAYDPKVGNIYWDYFLTNVWDVEQEAEPSKYPHIAREKIHYGLTPTDWSVLFPYIRKPEFLLKRLQTWIDTGYITKEQAKAIRDQARGQSPSVLYSWTMEGMKKHLADVEKDEARVTYPTRREEDWENKLWARVKAGELTSEQAISYLDRREEARARAIRRRKLAAQPVEFGPALEEIRAEFAEEMPPTERWRDWFRSKYGLLVEQYKGQVPEAQRSEKSWREYLKRRKPEIREQFWKLSPYERGERPSVFAPRITTVRF